MNCPDTKCKTVDVPGALGAEGDPVHHKCKNSKGEHLNNVDIEVVQMASGMIRIFVRAIIDDRQHGAPYEETSREILSAGTKALDVNLGNDMRSHEQSWFDIESNGWNDPDDRMHHLPDRFQAFVKTAAETGLSLVRSVD